MRNVTKPPFVHAMDLSRLPDGETVVVLVPNDRERSDLATWLGIDKLTRLKATVALERAAGSQFSFTADFEADVLQSCVVTLEPVASRIERHFQRMFQLPAGRSAKSGQRTVQLADLDESEPEIVDDPVIDIAAPVLEELRLSIDPYPRAPGAVFQPPKEREARTSPFDVLKSLKNKG